MAQSKTMQIIVEMAGKISPTLGKSMKSVQSSLSKLNLKGLAVAGTVAVVAYKAGKALAELGMKWNDASDRIRVGTGATGEALEALNKSMENVYSRVPVENMNDLADVISTYNTRLGISGETLEKLTEQAFKATHMLGGSAMTLVETSAKAFNSFNLPVEEYSNAMDYIFKVSQSTGKSMDALFNDLQNMGPQLQAVGFSFRDSAALIGAFDKSGLEANQMLSALKTAAQQATKSGFATVNEGVIAYINAIQNAKTDTKALSIATKYFGSKSAAAMVKAIKDGTLNTKQFTEALEKSDETIKKAYGDTADFREQFKLLKQNAEVALRPLANSLFEIINDLMPTLKNLFEGIMPIIVAIGDLLVPVVKLCMDLLQPIIDTIGWIFKGISKVIGWFNDREKTRPSNTNKSNTPDVISLIPKYGKGGFTHGLSIAGEAGREAIISFNPVYRDRNVDVWSQAGRLLGMEDFSLGAIANSSQNVTIDFSGFTWSPNIVTSGDTESDTLMEKLRSHEAEFFSWLDKWVRIKGVVAYGR